MGHLEGNFTPVLYIWDARFPKVNYGPSRISCVFTLDFLNVFSKDFVRIWSVISEEIFTRPSIKSVFPVFFVLIHVCVCDAPKLRMKLFLHCNYHLCNQLTSLIETKLTVMCCRQVWIFVVLRYDLDGEVWEVDIGSVCSKKGKVGIT